MANSSLSFSITLIRHGQTFENTKGIIQGAYNSKLNETGILQARQLASKFPVYEYKLIYSSDLSRAYDTARELTTGHHPEESIRKDPRLRERSLGILDGTHVSGFLELCREANLHPDEYTPEGGETAEVLRGRLLHFIEERLLDEISEALESGLSDELSAKVLLVSHGAAIRELIKYFRSFDHESWSDHTPEKIRTIPPNTSVNEFRIHFEHTEELLNGDQESESDSLETRKPKKIKTVECVRLHDLSHLEDQMKHQAENQQRVNTHTV